MTTNIKHNNNRSMMMMGILIAVFFGPIIVALSLYSTQSFVPETLNHGQLLDPPLTLADLQLTNIQHKLVKEEQLPHAWRLLYINHGHCNKLCQDNLYKMRQVRKAMGKNMNRVSRIMVEPTSAKQANAIAHTIAKKYHGTLLVEAEQHHIQKFINDTPNAAKNNLDHGALYIVDPLGNVILSYSANAKPKDIYQDLKRLLTASQIG